MKHHKTVGTIFMIALFALIMNPGSARSQSENNDQEVLSRATGYGWPYMVQSGTNAITIFQPWYESWIDNQLKARAAVSVTAKASAQPVYGVVFFTARTSVDPERRTVILESIRIDRVNFPNTNADISEYRVLIDGGTAQWPRRIPLGRLQADLAINKAVTKTERHVAVKNEPPRIFYSEKPAVLVLIDGEPVPRALPGTDIMRIINTRALLLADKNTGFYYLYVSDHWEQARRIDGAWSRAEDTPESLADILDDARQAETTDLLNNARTAGPVTIFASTRPAEVLVTRGKPNLQPIDGTQLLYCANSDNDIFFNLPDQNFYILSTGRWFKGKNLENGPWSFIDGKNLPAEFAKIPESHIKGNILASVPGTPQAKEAVISASIPKTATVRRDRVSTSVTYDGNPQFKQIEETPLKYAINTPVPVIEVDPQSYFCVVNGVWFSASGPLGPWVAADYVPAIIYTIPPSSPIHYVVYVRVYGSTSRVIYVGYTPGYYGALIGIDGTVIYGTGYCYTPWIGTVWYGYPVTWGCGISFGWYPWGWGWGWGYYGWHPFFRPWWGPWWGWGSYWWRPWAYRNSVSFHMNAYHHWHGKVIMHRLHGNPWSHGIIHGGWGYGRHHGGFHHSGGFWRGWGRRR